jgi:hypothetical protein
MAIMHHMQAFIRYIRHETLNPKTSVIAAHASRHHLPACVLCTNVSRLVCVSWCHRFVVVQHGLEERRTPGNTLAVQPDKPYQGLSMFGTGERHTRGSGCQE